MSAPGWRTDRITLDPSAVMLTMQARARPDGHWVRVQQMEARRRRRRAWANAVLGAVVLGATLALVSLALALGVAWP